MKKIYFYPHKYMRDRQLDTIRRWPRHEVLNAEYFKNRKGKQVYRSNALKGKISFSWNQRIPLINIKLRPKSIPDDAVVYMWGAVIATGKFIVDLDNPYSLVGYNLRAMSLWKYVIRCVLLSDRCLEIRCISQACKKSLYALFGSDVVAKAGVNYPCIKQQVQLIESVSKDGPRFLFVGTQFEIKGGVALLRVWRKVIENYPTAKLDVITHLPDEYKHLANTPGLVVHSANFSRDEIWRKFMRNSDVFVLPTYVESFGMVALEALAHGLALIATDVYALSEMVKDGVNGDLLSSPISIWDGVLPSAAYYDLSNIKQRIRATDKNDFEMRLEEAIERFVSDPDWRLRARQSSTKLMQGRFAC